jgi:hypothetical protein
MAGGALDLIPKLKKSIQAPRHSEGTFIPLSRKLIVMKNNS